MNLQDTVFWSWEFLAEIMPNILNIKTYIDRKKDNELLLYELNKSVRNLASKIKQLRSQRTDIKSKLDTRDETFKKAQSIKDNINQPDNAIPYKDKVDFITQYVNMQTQLNLLVSLFNLLAKGPKDDKRIPDQNEEIQKLQDQLETITQTIGSKYRKYQKILNETTDATRSTEDSLAIKEYTSLENQRDKLRKKLQLKTRTISEQMKVIDIKSIDASKIADKIIKALSNSDSLLSILLNKSINTFVKEYLTNNKYTAPNFTRHMQLLHYYLSDGEPDKNVRLIELKQFTDSDKNEDLLTHIAEEILLKDPEDNILSQFLSILKSDYAELYKDSYLSVLSKTNLFLVDSETHGEKYKRGPCTLKSIADLFQDIKTKDITVGQKISSTLPNGEEIELEVIESKLDGKQLWDLLKRNNQNIDILFNRVLVYIKKYIQERLQYKSYEICNNTGDNFYSILLAETAQDDIAEIIDYNKLDQWIATKDKNSAKRSKANIEQNIDDLIEAYIQALCKEYSNDGHEVTNEYELFVLFFIFFIFQI